MRGPRKVLVNQPSHPILRYPSPSTKGSTSNPKALSYSKKLVAPTGSTDDSDPENAFVDPASPSPSNPHFLSLIHFH